MSVTYRREALVLSIFKFPLADFNIKKQGKWSTQYKEMTLPEKVPQQFSQTCSNREEVNPFENLVGTVMRFEENKGHAWSFLYISVLKFWCSEIMFISPSKKNVCLWGTTLWKLSSNLYNKLSTLPSTGLYTPIMKASKLSIGILTVLTSISWLVKDKSGKNESPNSFLCTQILHQTSQ